MIYVVHIDCEQFFVHACGLIYTWLVDSNFSQKHSIFNRLIKKETPQNGVFLDVLIIPPQHNFDLPSFITFYFNSSIKLFISQFRILCWQKNSAFCLQKRIILAYIIYYYWIYYWPIVKEQKITEPPHLHTKYNERKKNPPELFCEIAIVLFSSPFFARKSFLAQLNALFKNIRKQKTQNPLYKSFGLKRCGSRSFFLGKWVSLKRYDHSGIVYPNNKRSNLASILIKHHPALNLSSS